jgi:hypothetical protein
VSDVPHEAPSLWLNAAGVILIAIFGAAVLRLRVSAAG